MDFNASSALLASLIMFSLCLITKTLDGIRVVDPIPAKLVFAILIASVVNPVLTLYLISSPVTKKWFGISNVLLLKLTVTSLDPSKFLLKISSFLYWRLNCFLTVFSVPSYVAPFVSIVALLNSFNISPPISLSVGVTLVFSLTRRVFIKILTSISLPEAGL